MNTFLYIGRQAKITILFSKLPERSGRVFVREKEKLHRSIPMDVDIFTLVMSANSLHLPKHQKPMKLQDA